MMALGKPLDLTGSHLPRCKPSSCFSSEDFVILESPPVVLAKLPGAKGQKQLCAGVPCAATTLTCTGAVGVRVWHIPGQG